VSRLFLSRNIEGGNGAPGLKTVETIARLATHPAIKGALVKRGVLGVLQGFTQSRNQEVTRCVMKALNALAVRDTVHDRQIMGQAAYWRQQLVERRRAEEAHQEDAAAMSMIEAGIIHTDNGALVRFIFKCTKAALSRLTGAATSEEQGGRPDPQMRRQAIATLQALLGSDASKVAMMATGVLPRFMDLLGSRDIVIRRGAAAALANLAKLGFGEEVPRK
jgi:hypothetical protein